MQDNFLHALYSMVAFLVANGVFAAILVYYRASHGQLPSWVPTIPAAIKEYLLKANIVKICAIFAAMCFVIFIINRHTGIGCEDLDLDAQCECYALEVAHHADPKEKVLWLNNGLRMCPDSHYFLNFVKKQPSP